MDGCYYSYCEWIIHACVSFCNFFFDVIIFLLKCHNLIFHVFLQLTAGFRSRGLPSVMPVGGSKWLSLRAINWITHSTHWFLSGTIKQLNLEQRTTQLLFLYFLSVSFPNSASVFEWIIESWTQTIVLTTLFQLIHSKLCSKSHAL